MAIDWDKNVLAPVMGVFGEPVTYMPATGSPFSITGVFDEAYTSVVMQEGGVPMTTESPLLGVRVAEFPQGRPPRKGDLLSIASVNSVFTVKDVRFDGHGEAKLMLSFRNAIP